MEEIRNKVAQSGLVEFNLEEYYNHAEKVHIDLKDFLSAIPLGNSNAYILKEKPFRELVSKLDLSNFQNKLVAISCSVDAIVPTWAYMLLSLALTPIAKKVVIGSLTLLDEILFIEALNKIEGNKFQDAKVVIKGCSKFNVPISAYAQIAVILKPFAKSIMFGEPCSTVPLYKRPKTDA